MEPNSMSYPFTLNGLSVLVVEDAWQVAKAMKALLEQHKIDVMGPVATAADARRQIGIRKPHAALVDINLKGELAWDLIDDLCAQDIEVIVISGYPQPRALARASLVHLQKPYDAEELLAALCAIAGKNPRR
jgi:DNA-binding response OmpR family regulator